ncbi:zinc-binding alcohol dehydrogenase family protein [Paraburkholderia xenovorans]|uniref:quinone oxidoreductase family protein n=1 Tax=Paraburkholderia xenovorans TaxID=36873 RepID=UPI0038B993C4
MKAVRVTAPSANVDSIDLQIAAQLAPTAGAQECLIKVVSAGVNPSDVKAVLGAMPHAVWPRTPGRDFAGIVLEGPEELVGQEVWGSGGELGIRRNGSHASYLTVPASGVRKKPANLTMEEAGSIGVPFITAFEGLRRAGGVKEGDVVLVLGANGKVGQATVQLATNAGAKVFGVERTAQNYLGHANSEVTMIDASSQNIAEVVRAATHENGANIIYNTVGSPYFEQANAALAKRGTQIFISTLDRAVPFDIFSFYRGQHTYVGIDTLALDSADGAQILDQLLPLFLSGKLKPFPIYGESVFSIDDTVHAYQAVLRGSTHRVLINP